MLLLYSIVKEQFSCKITPASLNYSKYPRKRMRISGIISHRLSDFPVLMAPLIRLTFSTLRDLNLRKRICQCCTNKEPCHKECPLGCYLCERLELEITLVD